MRPRCCGARGTLLERRAVVAVGRTEETAAQEAAPLFPRSRAIATELVVLPHVGSTNDVIAQWVRAGRLTASYSAVATLDQRAGHGRQGRVWTSPPGGALAASVLVRVDHSESAGLLPLVAGAAMTQALRELGVPAGLKWPNDVLVGGAKICGILCLLAAPGCVVVGSGVNIHLEAATAAHLGLHGTRATALNLEGCDATADDVLSTYLTHLREGVAVLETDRRSAVDAVRAVCDTIDSRVRLELPDGSQVTGTARDLADTGALMVETAHGIRPFVAGDVTHLRPAVERYQA